MQSRSETFVESWSGWKELWESTDQFEFRHSLLHCGLSFSVSYEEDVERICFLLEIADGHESWLGFKQPHESDYKIKTALGTFERMAELRQELSEKAFQALCLKFFKNQNDPRYADYSWKTFLSDQRVFEKVIWFFRRHKRGGLENLISMRDDNHAQTVREFLSNLIPWVWRNDRSSAQFHLARPKLVHILYALGKINWLLDESRFPLDFCSASELYDLAMGSELKIPGEYQRRLPETLEEAIAGGSKAAEILLILQTRSRERKRLNRIKKLRKAEADLQQRRERLLRRS